MKDHSTFSMGQKSAEFCLQLLKSKDLIESRLSSIYEKRKEARKYLHEVSNAHNLAGEAIRRLEDENNVHFVLINSLLENSGKINDDETAQSLSLKLEETRDLINEEMVDVEILEKQYLQHINGKTKITFACIREGMKVPSTMPSYDQKSDANNRDNLEQSKMLKAATHVLLSLLKIGDSNNPKDAAQPSPSTSGASNLPNVLVNRVNPMMPSTQLENVVFSIKFQQSSATSETVNYGTVLIKPSTAFYGPPSGSFGLFTLKTPPELYKTSISKVFLFLTYYMCISTLKLCNNYVNFLPQAVAGESVYFPGISHLLQKLFPDPMKLLSQAVIGGSNDPLDVKLIDCSIEGNVQNSHIPDFELAFFLNQLNPSLMRRKRWVHFGKIVDGEKVMQALSKLFKVKRSDFSVYIEYRCI